MSDQLFDTLEEAAGQLFIAGFDGAGESPPAAIERALRAGHLGGVILFSRNVETPEQVGRLNQAIHGAGSDAALRPFVSVDQEGGPVMRMRDGLTDIPPMQKVGSGRDQRAVADVSQVIATEIAALGFNVNFAPVLDVDSNPQNPIIGERSFGSSPGWVGIAGGSYLLGHTTAGVIPCGKHFPGHGDTDVDSHEDLPVVTHDRERLDEVELTPFRQAVRADFPMLMTAHIRVDALDDESPATFSPRVIQELLRDELGYEGVVVSDDLEMDAVADRYDIEEMVTRGLRAGVDLFLICHTEDKWQRAREALVRAAEDDEEMERRLRESAARVTDLKQGFLKHLPDPWVLREDWRERLASEEHRRIVQEACGD
jgi:beta-N-acetylhexosaminidase